MTAKQPLYCTDADGTGHELHASEHTGRTYRVTVDVTVEPPVFRAPRMTIMDRLADLARDWWRGVRQADQDAEDDWRWRRAGLPDRRVMAERLERIAAGNAVREIKR